jgi:hypothetical protein
MKRILLWVSFCGFVGGALSFWQTHQNEKVARIQLESLRPALSILKSRLQSDLSWLISALEAQVYQGFDWVAEWKPGASKPFRVLWDREVLDEEVSEKLGVQAEKIFSDTTAWQDPSQRLVLRSIAGRLWGFLRLSAPAAPVVFRLPTDFLVRASQLSEASQFVEILDEKGNWVYHPIELYRGQRKNHPAHLDWQGQKVQGLSAELIDTNLSLQIWTRTSLLAAKLKESLIQIWMLILGMGLMGAGVLVLGFPRRSSAVSQGNLSVSPGSLSMSQTSAALGSPTQPATSVVNSSSSVSSIISPKSSSSAAVGTAVQASNSPLASSLGKDPLVPLDWKELLLGAFDAGKFSSPLPEMRFWGHRKALTEFFSVLAEVLQTEESSGSGAWQFSLRQDKSFDEFCFQLPIASLRERHWSRLQEAKSLLTQDNAQLSVLSDTKGTRVILKVLGGLRIDHETAADLAPSDLFPQWQDESPLDFVEKSLHRASSAEDSPTPARRKSIRTQDLLSQDLMDYSVEIRRPQKRSGKEKSRS